LIISLLCVITRVIILSKKLIQYSRTKHIEVRHYFLRDHMLKGDIVLKFVSTEHQLANIFTKSLGKDHFCEIQRNLSCIHTNDI
jgi:hypothetical protein